jgi:hypothetical protein
MCLCNGLNRNRVTQRLKNKQVCVSSCYHMNLIKSNQDLRAYPMVQKAYSIIESNDKRVYNINPIA